MLPYCHTADDIELVSRRRLVIATCTTAGKLYELALQPGHFTHVFVDEVTPGVDGVKTCLLHVNVRCKQNAHAV